MKDRTEWDLLVVAEEIEQGDVLVVEADGDTEEMVFVKEKDSKTIILKDKTKTQRFFSKHSLEERGGDYVILGKKEED